MPRSAANQNGGGKALAPGLDHAAPYVSRLSARSALFTEFHLLLDRERAALSLAEYRALVVTENKLSRSSASARGKLWKELKGRYRLDAADPLFNSFWTEWQRCASEAERGLTAYVLLALNDHLVADLGTAFLFPLLRRAPAELRVTDVLAFIERAATLHTEVRAWSKNTRRSLAQDYCASMGGRWEVGVVKRLPIPNGRREQRQCVGTLARAIHDAKSFMDEGNETSTIFRTPWILRAEKASHTPSIATRLNHLAEDEQAGTARVEKMYAEINDEVCCSALARTTRWCDTPPPPWTIASSFPNMRWNYHQKTNWRNSSTHGTWRCWGIPETP